MIPYGVARPYLFQPDDANTFGTKLPKESPMVGSYAPPANKEPAHGIMVKYLFKKLH